MLRAWDDAPAIIVSCPGPLRRHAAAIQPVAALALPQCLLGGEAQLQAFAASAPELAPRLFFTPMPELFGNPRSLHALLAATGGAALDPGARPVHLRFGGTRSARIMKDARNGLVLAENHAAPPLTASRHPFADGLTLPTLMRRLFTYERGVARPVTIEGAALPLTRMADTAALADLPARVPADGDSGATEGLEVISLAEFRSAAWAAGPVRARSPHVRDALAASETDGAPFVLLPWNLDDPGSAVPAIIERTLRLQPPDCPSVRLLIMPYNYPGQTGLIRRLIRQVREAGAAGDRILTQVFIGRLTHMRALGALRALAGVAWVDGNDPECAWTARRLAACGISPILLAASGSRPPDGIMIVPVDEALTITTDTRFGLLHFRAQLPSLRALRQLLPLTLEMAAPARTRRQPARRARKRVSA